MYDAEGFGLNCNESMRMSSTLLVTCSKPLIVLILGEKKFHGGVNLILPLPFELERDGGFHVSYGSAVTCWLLLLLRDDPGVLRDDPGGVLVPTDPAAAFLALPMGAPRVKEDACDPEDGVLLLAGGPAAGTPVWSAKPYWLPAGELWWDLVFV